MRGFTLVEVMLVVAIAAILTAIAIPNYYQYIKHSQRSACLSEVKNYSNNILYAINDQDDATDAIAPIESACHFITDATGWTSETQQKIIATAKSPSNASIECDIPNGASCRILP